MKILLGFLMMLVLCNTLHWPRIGRDIPDQPPFFADNPDIFPNSLDSIGFGSNSIDSYMDNFRNELDKRLKETEFTDKKSVEKDYGDKGKVSIEEKWNSNHYSGEVKHTDYKHKNWKGSSYYSSRIISSEDLFDSKSKGGNKNSPKTKETSSNEKSEED
eukprot:CAMPEP_0196995118 /NCGR_PEP_ID=MMETSP1380-20130617/1304_1 /TAXON_ID=5936 /ORGANISM="Euplotes crassus, Strain CT5" /LENGTH=158 /DNA_ID=CAMNT_0042410701 /DNA_START=26 /DNA_END=502 /DNA_ORIENTATION=+